MLNATYEAMPKQTAAGTHASRWGFASLTATPVLAGGIWATHADKRFVVRHSGNVWPLSPSGVSSG